MLLTSSLKFCSSSYFSFALQLNVGCFMMDPLILSPALPCLDVPAMAMVWIATLAALAIVCMMNSFWHICSLAIFFCLAVFLQFVYESAYMRLPFHSHLCLLKLPNLSLPYCFSLPFWDCLHLTPFSVPCLIQRYHWYALDGVFISMCEWSAIYMLKYTYVVHPSGLCTWHLLVTILMQEWMW